MIRPSTRRSQTGFTLMEVVLAMLLVSFVAYSLAGGMHAIILAKRRAIATVEPIRAVVVAADLMRQDLESVLPPTGILAGQFLGTHVTAAGGDNDTLVFYCLGEDSATIQREQQQQQQGVLQQEDPLAEGMRKVELGIRTDTNPPVLVRRVTRNLMASADPKVEEEIICRDVRSFSLRYFDGTTWQEDWDSTVMGDVLPLSVALTVELNDPNNPLPAKSTRRVTRIIPMSCAKELDITSGAGGVP